MALCAIVLSWQTFIILHKSPISYHLYFFTFFATLLSYNTHFYLAAQRSRSSEQLRWFHQTKKQTLFFNGIVLIATFYFFYYLQSIAVYIVVAVVLNAAYTAPLLLNKALKLPLLFTFVKSYFIGFIWTFVTAILPMLILNQKTGQTEIAIFLHRFLLVSSATLIFDYRDKLRDLELGVHTPANKMKEEQFHWFYILNLLLLVASVVLLSVTTKQLAQWLQMIPCLTLWWAFLRSKKRTDDLFYLTMVDGALFLSAILSIFLLI